MSLGHLQTNRLWSESLSELKEEFRKWGVQDYTLPTYNASRQAVQVSFAINGLWSYPTCSRFPTREQNLRAIVMAVHAVRLASQRGIGELIAEASKHLALPSGRSGELDPYMVLGVSRDTTPGSLKAAYRKRVQETHPDHGGDPEEFKKVLAAGQALEANG